MLKVKEKKKVLKRNPDGTLTLNEALILLKNKSDIGKMGLYIAAKRDDFQSIHTGKGKERFLLDKIKFNKWIKETIDIIQDGFISVAVAARKLDITTSYVYLLIKKFNIKTITVGGGKGKEYVNFASLQKVYKKKER